jgi:hypothetical protein
MVSCQIVYHLQLIVYRRACPPSPRMTCSMPDARCSQRSEAEVELALAATQQGADALAEVTAALRAAAPATQGSGDDGDGDGDDDARTRLIERLAEHVTERMQLEQQQQGLEQVVSQLSKDTAELARRRAAQLEKPMDWRLQNPGRKWDMQALTAKALEVMSAEVSVWEQQHATQAELLSLYREQLAQIKAESLRQQWRWAQQDAAKDHILSVADLEVAALRKQAQANAAQLQADFDQKLAAARQEQVQLKRDSEQQLAVAKAEYLEQHGQTKAQEAELLARASIEQQQQLQQVTADSQQQLARERQHAVMEGMRRGLAYLDTRWVDLSDGRLLGDVGPEQALAIARACGPELDALFLPVPLVLAPEVVAQLREACPRARCLALGAEVTQAGFEEILRQYASPDAELGAVLQRRRSEMGVVAAVAEGVPPSSSDVELGSEPQPELEPEDAAAEIYTVTPVESTECYMLDLTDPQFKQITDVGLGAPAVCYSVCLYLHAG